MTKEISTYEFIKNATFRIDDESNILKGVTICGPGRDQRSYYATSPEKGEGTLTLDVLEEALAIVKLFNKKGYNFIINEVIGTVSIMPIVPDIPRIISIATEYMLRIWCIWYEYAYIIMTSPRLPPA